MKAYSTSSKYVWLTVNEQWSYWYSHAYLMAMIYTFLNIVAELKQGDKYTDYSYIFLYLKWWDVIGALKEDSAKNEGAYLEATLQTHSKHACWHLSFVLFFEQNLSFVLTIGFWPLTRGQPNLLTSDEASASKFSVWTKQGRPVCPSLVSLTKAKDESGGPCMLSAWLTCEL